ncbi:MAG: PAS domain S-box protein [Dehalococcoidales bacterium]|jgi:PAS domain S-box-containing protein
MRDSQKTRNQLLNELHEARRQVEMLAAAEVERKQVGDKLNASEEKFYKAFLSSPDMIIITSIPQGKYVEVNESYTRITGYSREELIGHTSEEINMFARPEEQTRMMQLLKEQGSFSNEEFTFRVRSGEIRRWLCSAQIINIDGETCTISVAVDITDLKNMERALNESEEKFSKVFSLSPNAICLVNIEESRFIEVNDSFVRFVGYPREEIIGHTADELNLWVNQYDIQNMGKSLQQTGRMVNTEIKSRMKSGKIRSGLFSAETIEIGGQPRMMLVVTDITGKMKAEEALRESEEKFTKIFHAAPLGVTISRLADGVLMEVNESFISNFGFNREEVIGRSTLELNIWLKPAQREKMIETLTTQGRVSNEEYQLRNKSGEVHTYLFSAELIDCDGESCILAMTNDITNYKRMEAQALEAENLREVDRLRAELLANVSHELRTPLASIKGFATMLLDYSQRLKPSEKRDYLETIDNNTDRLVALIEQLLEMSRLGAGMSSIKKITANASKLCKDVIYQARIRVPDHVFLLDLPPRLPLIDIDLRRIRQVLDNILDNAVKYSNPGTEITLSVRKTGPEILFTIADHGSGISKADLPRMFEKGFHSSHGLKTGIYGAGLGLSICKALVEAHGGRIWLESEEGKGTIASFTLPLKTASVGPPQEKGEIVSHN